MNNISEITIIASAQNHSSLYSVMIKSLCDSGSKVIFIAEQATLDSLDFSKNIYAMENLLIEKRLAGESLYRLVLRYKRLIFRSKSIIFDEPYESLMSIFKALWMIPKEVKKHFVIHNANKWFMYPFVSVHGSIFRTIIRKLIISKADSFVVISPIMKRYIKDICLCVKPIYYFPFALPKEMTQVNKETNKVITLVIPGIISIDRRNYDLIINVIEKLCGQGNDNIRLKLLGHTVLGENSGRILERCDSINKKQGVKIIKCWDKRLSPKEFENEIITSDIILANIILFCKGKLSGEIYGITKETGITYQMLQYNKPMICTKALQVMQEFSSQLLRYDDEESLMNIMIGISNGNIDIEDLKKSAVENGAKFCEVVKKDIELFCNSVR